MYVTDNAITLNEYILQHTVERTGTQIHGSVKQNLTVCF